MPIIFDSSNDPKSARLVVRTAGDKLDVRVKNATRKLLSRKQVYALADELDKWLAEQEGQVSKDDSID